MKLIKKHKNTSSSECQAFYQLGRRKKDNNHYDEALRDFAKARQKFNKNQDTDYRLTDLTIDEGRIYRIREEFAKATAIYDKRLEQINKFYSGISQKSEEYVQKMQQKCKILSEKHQNMLSLVQKKYPHIDSFLKNRNADQFCKDIDKCINYAAHILGICVQILLSQDQRQLSQQEIKDWEQLYAQAIINSIDPILIQAQKIQNQQNLWLFKLIFRIANKMGQFYEISQKSKKIKQQNARSFYYRGAMLGKYSIDYRQIQSYLKKDKKFCEQNKQNSKQIGDDLQKNRRQYLRYYLNRHLFKQIFQICKSDDEKKKASACMKDFRNVEQMQKQIKNEKFWSYNSKDEQIDFIQRLVAIVQSDAYLWWDRFIDIAKDVTFLVKHKQVKYLIYFYCARGYCQQFNYINAIDSIEKALILCDKGSQQNFQSLFLKMQIYHMWQNKNRLQIEKIQNQVRQLAESFDGENRQNKILQVNNQIQLVKFLVKRAKKHEQLLLMTERQKQLFAQLKFKRQKSRSIIHKIQDANRENFQHQNSNSLQFGNLFKQKSRQQKILTKQQQLQQKYRQKCKQKGIKLRQYIIDKIKNQRTQKIILQMEQFFGFQASQLQVLLQIGLFYQLDLRNFKIDSSVLQIFIGKGNLRSTKTIKLLDLNKHTNLTFNRMIHQCENLEQLHLQKLEKKFVFNPENLFQIPLINSFALKKLKLKFCKISDENIKTICNIFFNLTQLDLSGNALTGQQLNSLQKIKTLYNLNLSYNPLMTGIFLDHPNIRKLKLKGISSNEQIKKTLHFGQLKYLFIFDVSENNSSFICNVLQNTCRIFFQQQIFSIPYFHELKIKKCNIEDQVFQQLDSFIRFCQKQINIDLRFSYYNENKLTLFRQYQQRTRKSITFNINSKARSHQPLAI